MMSRHVIKFSISIFGQIKSAVGIGSVKPDTPGFLLHLILYAACSSLSYNHLKESHPRVFRVSKILR